MGIVMYDAVGNYSGNHRWELQIYCVSEVSVGGRYENNRISRTSRWELRWELAYMMRWEIMVEITDGNCKLTIVIEHVCSGRYENNRISTTSRWELEWELGWELGWWDEMGKVVG